MFNLAHINSLMGSVDHLFWLLTSDGGVIMNNILADEIMNRTYCVLCGRAEAITIELRIPLRTTALDPVRVQKLLRVGSQRVDPSDIRPGGESCHILERVLANESHEDQIHIRESRSRADKAAESKKNAPSDMKPPGAERPRPPRAGGGESPMSRSGNNKGMGSGRPKVPRAGGDGLPSRVTPRGEKLAGGDPFKIYSRAERTAHYKKMQEENRLRLTNSKGELEDEAMLISGLMHAGALTEATGTVDSFTPVEREQPDAQGDVEGVGVGPTTSGGCHTVLLASVELQRGRVFIPSKKINGVTRQ